MTGESKKLRREGSADSRVKVPWPIAPEDGGKRKNAEDERPTLTRKIKPGGHLVAAEKQGPIKGGVRKLARVVGESRLLKNDGAKNQLAIGLLSRRQQKRRMIPVGGGRKPTTTLSKSPDKRRFKKDSPAGERCKHTNPVETSSRTGRCYSNQLDDRRTRTKKTKV